MENTDALWNKECEKKFFEKSLKNAEKIFYNVDGRFMAYYLKSCKYPKSTLQSRNSYIGNFTEKWTACLISKVLPGNLYAVNNVECADLGLTSKSPADLVISKKSDKVQNSSDVLIVFEIKMSIVWNWELVENREIQYLGDYKTHTGIPSLLRSDSVLKAIGKSINIRISGEAAKHIPIVVIGNSPITKSYYDKVDNLRTLGIVQNIWSVNPSPLDHVNDKDNLKETKGRGFVRLDSLSELKRNIEDLVKLNKKLDFFFKHENKRRNRQIYINCL
jgi:hypothetical protein